MSNTPKSPIEPQNVWFDALHPDVEIPHDQFKQYLQDKHGITDLRGRKTMISHVDGSDFFASTYRWEIAGKDFVQLVSQPRRGLSRRYWGRY